MARYKVTGRTTATITWYVHADSEGGARMEPPPKLNETERGVSFPAGSPHSIAVLDGPDGWEIEGVEVANLMAPNSQRPPS